MGEQARHGVIIVSGLADESVTPACGLAGRFERNGWRVAFFPSGAAADKDPPSHLWSYPWLVVDTRFTEWDSLQRGWGEGRICHAVDFYDEEAMAGIVATCLLEAARGDLCPITASA